MDKGDRKMSKIIGDNLPNIPWQEKPEGFNGPI